MVVLGVCHSNLLILCISRSASRAFFWGPRRLRLDPVDGLRLSEGHRGRLAHARLHGLIACGWGRPEVLPGASILSRSPSSTL